MTKKKNIKRVKRVICKCCSTMIRRFILLSLCGIGMVSFVFGTAFISTSIPLFPFEDFETCHTVTTVKMPAMFILDMIWPDLFGSTFTILSVNNKTRYYYNKGYLYSSAPEEDEFLCFCDDEFCHQWQTPFDKGVFLSFGSLISAISLLVIIVSISIFFTDIICSCTRFKRKKNRKGSGVEFQPLKDMENPNDLDLSDEND